MQTVGHLSNARSEVVATNGMFNTPHRYGPSAEAA